MMNVVQLVMEAQNDCTPEWYGNKSHAKAPRRKALSPLRLGVFA